MVHCFPYHVDKQMKIKSIISITIDVYLFISYNNNTKEFCISESNRTLQKLNSERSIVMSDEMSLCMSSSLAI